MREPDYDAMLFAAADRHMSGGSHPEGEVTFTVERDVEALPEILRVMSCLQDAECCELEVSCEVDDTDAVVEAVIGYDAKGKAFRTKTPAVVIPLTKWETQWTVEVAIEQAERRASIGDDRTDDRWDD